MTAIDWDHPTEIPVVAEPAKLPPGAGSAIMNELARRALAAGVPSLRYAGPYPTSALWATLLRSFRTSGTEADFTRDALARALRVARDPIPIDFAPAPHERRAFARGHAELRDGLERVVIDGASFTPDGSPGRLVQRAAEIWFGDRCYARVGTFGSDGAPLGDIQIPASTSRVLGQVFPDALREALAGLVAETVAAPLADAARAAVASRTIAWADLGARAARVTPDGFTVHAAIWDALAPQGLPRVALALAEALGPVVATWVISTYSSSI
ncbi:MAG TPA: hypothetical protein VGM88_10905 [Kofleriaceae bacterium]